jgi:hypothetical protein
LPLCFLRRPALFGHPICCYIHSGSIVADAAVNEDFLWAADILLHPSCQAISSGNLLSHPKIRQDCSYLFFGRVFLHGIRVVLEPSHSNLNSVVVQTTNAYNYEHTSTAGR